MDNNIFKISSESKEIIESMNLQNDISLEKYNLEVIEQNKIILNELCKYDKNSKMYKLKMIQYKTNIMNMEINKKLGVVLVGQNID
jgi:hypothetical protein